MCSSQNSAREENKMLRYSADRRSVAYILLTIVLAVVQWILPAPSWPLYALYVWMGITLAVISHNHNHVSMWRSKWLNLATSCVISIFYGFPAIGWVPTHNQNHHRYNNREGDSGRSPIFFRSNHLLALLTYPVITGINQQGDIVQFLRELWRRDRRGFWMAATEYLVFFGFLAAVFLADWRKALMLHLIPQQVALFAIQIVNYVQHVEADAESDWNHSRNFVSPSLNALLFNNGYHTVHHLKPGVHWSQTPSLHAKHASQIPADLQITSWWAYMLWTFFLRPFSPGKAQRAALEPK
jgi:beta-carotene hydroxylase